MTLNEVIERVGRAPSRVIYPPIPSIACLVEWQYEGVYLEAEIDVWGGVEWMRRDEDGSFDHWEG